MFSHGLITLSGTAAGALGTGTLGLFGGVLVEATDQMNLTNSLTVLGGSVALLLTRPPGKKLVFDGKVSLYSNPFVAIGPYGSGGNTNVEFLQGILFNAVTQIVFVGEECGRSSPPPRPGRAW